MSSQEKSDTLEAYQGSADEDEENVVMAQEPRKRALEEETDEEEDDEELLEAAGAAGVTPVGCKTCGHLIHKLKKLAMVACHHKCAMLKQKSAERSTKEPRATPQKLKTPAEDMPGTSDDPREKPRIAHQIKVKKFHSVASIPSKSTGVCRGL